MKYMEELLNVLKEASMACSSVFIIYEMGYGSSITIQNATIDSISDMRLFFEDDYSSIYIDMEDVMSVEKEEDEIDGDTFVINMQNNTRFNITIR